MLEPGSDDLLMTDDPDDEPVAPPLEPSFFNFFDLAKVRQSHKSVE